MKKSLLLGAAFALTSYSLPSHALVRVVQRCQTTNGAFQISIGDNEGIGMDRTPHYNAQIADDSQVAVAAYPISITHNGSISFGQTVYVDQETGGQKFKMSMGSTNWRHIELNAVLQNGRRISDDDIKCGQ